MDKTQLKGCLILIVEDYKDTRDAIRLFLEFCGARVLAAATGRDGLDLGKRSTNPIWRRDRFFGEVVSCNRKTKPVVIDNGAAGKKSSAWSMNSKRTDQTGRSSVEGGV